MTVKTQRDIDNIRRQWEESLSEKFPEEIVIEFYDNQPDWGDVQAFIGDHCVGTLKYADAYAAA
ncbi:MAG: hypothetical protein NTT76_19325 [Achromobacter xylosoxidans]|nr:hypothetical protein [Achromobacter xylosoxidans]